MLITVCLKVHNKNLHSQQCLYYLIGIREGCLQQLDLDVGKSTTRILKFSFKSCNLHKKTAFMYSCFRFEYICYEQVYNGLTYFENEKIITAYTKVFWSLEHFLLFSKPNINYSNSSTPEVFYTFQQVWTMIMSSIFNSFQ